MVFTATASLEGINDVWETGRQLLNLSVSLGQNDKSSACTVTLADPGGKIANRLIQHSVDTGGIVGLPADKPASTAEGDGAITVNSAGGVGVPKEQDIVKECLRQGVTDRQQIAYILASCKHETGNFIYNEEIASGSAYEGRADLGNTQPGDGIKYKGRGLIMLTGRVNYSYWSKRLKKDLVGNPELAKVAGNALTISVVGMQLGTFTGRRLGRYIGGGKADYIGARAIVNGSDKAALIAGYARAYEPLVDSLIAGGDSSQATKTDPAAVAGAPSDPSDPAATVPTEGEGTVKGSKLTVTIAGVSYEFIHTGTATDNTGTLVLSGQGVRWIMNRRKHTRSYSDTNLKTLAEKVAKDHGATLDYSAEYNPAYAHIEQRGISDYELLVREARATGLFVSESNGKLSVKALTAINDTQLVYGPGQGLISWKAADQAISQMGDIEKDSGALQKDAKGQIDPATGQYSQSKPDIENTSQPGPSGNPSAEPTGTLAPGTEATAIASKARTKRVKGLPTELKVVMTLSALELQPLSAVRTKGLPEVLNRVWMVDEVKHDLAGASTTLKLYSPIEVLDLGTGDESAIGAAESADTGAGINGWVKPTTGIVTSLPGPRNGRMHYGVDLAGSLGTPVVAANDGVVTDVQNGCSVGDRSCGGGYGNRVYIDHPGGWKTRYAHMQRGSVTVRKGDQVKAGQIIGKQDNTGASSGVHLHLEVRQGARVLLTFEELGFTWVKDGLV